MSILSALRTAYGYEDAFGAKDSTTQEMRGAIEEWFQLYYNREAAKDEDPCQRIAYTIVNKLTKTAFGEYKATSEDDFAQAVLDALDSRKRKAMQLALIGGEALIKPFPSASGSFAFSIIPRNNLLVFGRDAEGRPTDIGTAERTIQGNSYYTLLERRTVDDKGYLTLRNRLYVSETPGTLGRPVSLQALPRYEALHEEYTYPVPLHGLGLALLKTPLENCVDGTHDGVSVYAPAVGLIHNIDRNEAQINGEFERGKSRIIVSDDLLRKGHDGRRRLVDDIFVGGGDENPEDLKPIIFSPELREKSFLARKQEYLRNAENIIGLKRGLLSEVEAAERTATEVTSSAGDYNLTIIDFQSMWEVAVKEAVLICGILGPMYRVPGAHEVDPDGISIDWGNGILYDEDKTWSDYLNMVSSGLLKPEIALGWRFGVPAETEGDLAAIRKKYMPTLQDEADARGEDG